MSAVEILIKSSYQGQGASAAKVDLSSIKALGKSVSDELKNAGKQMKEVGGKLTASVTLPILGIGGASLKLASDFEQTQVAFTTMLGDADKAKTLFNELRDFSASTPFEFPEIRDAGRSLLAFGVNAEDVTESLRRIGDISAGVGAPVGEIAELYGKAKVQGRLFAEDINQFQGRGIPILQELATVLGVSTAEVKNLVEKGKVGFPELEQAFQNMTNNGGQFAGMMEAQSQTLGGLFSTLKDTVTLTLADLGAQIIESFDLKTKLTGAIEFLGGLSEKIRSFAQSNPELFKLAVAFAAVAAAIGPVLVGVGWLATAIGSAMPVIAGIGAAIGAISAPIWLAAAGVGLLAAAIYNDWGGIGTFVSDMVSGIGDTLSALKEYFVAVVDDGDVLNDWLTHLPESLQPATQWFGNLVSATLNYRDAVLDAGFGSIESQESIGLFPAAIQPVIGWLDKLTGALQSLAGGQDIQTLQTNITAAFTDIGAAVKGFFSGDISLGGLASAVSQGFDSVKNALTAAFGSSTFQNVASVISVAWNGLVASLQASFSAIDWTGIGNSLIALPFNIAAYLLSIDWSGIGGYLSSFVTSVLAWFPTIDWSGIGGTLSGLATSVLTALAGLDWSPVTTSFDTLKAGVTTALEPVTTAISEKFTAISTAFTAFKLPTIDDIVTSMNGFRDAAILAIANAFTNLNLTDSISGFLTSITTAITGIDWSTAGASLATALSTALSADNLAAGFAVAAAAVAPALVASVAAITWVFSSDNFSNMTSSIGTAISNIDWSTVGERFGALKTAIGTALGDFADGFTGAFVTPEWLTQLMAWIFPSPLDLMAWLFPSPTALLGWSFPSPTALLGWSFPSPTALLGWSFPSPTALLGWSFPPFPSFSWPAMPGWMSGLFGGGEGNATGTSYWGGGLTWVGERGPELVNLPSGARVHNAVDSRRMADGGAVGGASITNHIYVQNDIDVEALLFKLEDMQRRRR